MGNLFDLLDDEEFVEEQPKKKSTPKQKKEKKSSDEIQKVEEKFKYPFTIYLAAENRDVSHIFDEGVEYSESEITKAMLEHGFYEFAGNVSYDFMESDNVIVPVFQQHKKG